MDKARHRRPRAFFTADEQASIVAAIEAAETRTSGEIRVHLEHKVPGGDPYARGKQLFEELGMTATQERNGVLVYLATGDGLFSVLGDLGIHQHVGEDFWNDVVAFMQERFRENDFAVGMSGGIERIGEKLAAYFPYAGDDADENELDDEISFGE